MSKANLQVFEGALKGLNSERFNERELATRSLVRLGLAARKPLRICLNKATDPEVKERIRIILNHLQKDSTRYLQHLFQIGEFAIFSLASFEKNRRRQIRAGDYLVVVREEGVVSEILVIRKTKDEVLGKIVFGSPRDRDEVYLYRPVSVVREDRKSED